MRWRSFVGNPESKEAVSKVTKLDDPGRQTAPMPVLEGLAGAFYEHCRRRELSFQRCSACRSWRHIPRPMCDVCGSDDWSWERSTGRGVVLGCTVVHRALHPGLEDRTPFMCGIVEMEEGVRLIARLLEDGGVPRPQIGTEVYAVYVDASLQVTLPAFRRVVGTGGEGVFI